MINREIKRYVEEDILPKYNNFDKGHDITHGRKVIENSMAIAADFDVDKNMVYIIAAFHDLGMEFGRQEHEIKSGEILINDNRLKNWFSTAQLEIMKEAVEDHRASSKQAPRSIYGKIVAEADRDIAYETILRRTVQFSIKNCPEFTKAQHFERCTEHIQNKYGEGGYLKLWLETAENVEGLKKIRKALKDEAKLYADFEELFEKYAE